MKLKPWPKGVWRKAEIHWRDSISLLQPWHDPQSCIEEGKNDHQDFIISSGFLFHRNKYYTYLALSMSLSNGKVVRFGDVLKIPNNCIIKTFYSDATTRGLGL